MVFVFSNSSELTKEKSAPVVVDGLADGIVQTDDVTC